MGERLPQSYQRISDVVDLLGRLHTEMRGLCESAGQAVGDARRRLLMETLAERQKGMADFLAASGRDRGEAVLDMWIQYVPNERIEKHLEKIRPSSATPGAFPEDFPERVLKFLDEVADVVQVIRAKSGSVEAEEFLQSLANRERAEARYSAEAIRGMADV